MPTSAPGQPAGTIRELGLPARAVTALTRAGITEAGELAALTRRELGAVPGLGPGLVTAIRAVVPEPPARLPGAGTRPGDGGGDAAPDEEGPVAPAIPSFDSLRGPRRRSAVDLLVPAAPGPPPPPGPVAPPPGPPPLPAARRPSPGVGGPPTAVRPPDYADLLRLGVHVTRVVLGAPVRCLHRLLGRGGPPAP
ncbi:DNA-directed RNA polymerase subunit alpha C-terminal domain-containing protein [Blastococcus sp. BMG 814]|uniref:DNA-directed RNA polymerase subunit alpha C-terminal domain-containing protein n=1 Tax=Blastococcus carthaginiensis TaxID=3050034 RepID=A0ABT9I807_9ACTN|nr:DNA-directed RNA polymerase subunit alpha C-terminal domain-containing protein [Blastococcus carthaginiensis]MDP5181700.1 DNA-directed RNA polymerase subunit alpha C-terminal domain-containing protein [Blastococcus carthaginiensis]